MGTTNDGNGVLLDAEGQYRVEVKAGALPMALRISS